MNDPALAMAAYLEGALSPADADALARAIREDPAVADIVSEMMMVDTHLRERTHRPAPVARIAQAMAEPKVPEPVEVPTTHRFPAAALMLIAAALIAAAAVGIGWLTSETEDKPQPKYANVVYAEDVQWDSPPAITGEDIVGHRVAIGGGKLDLMFDSGASVNVSGATELWITNPMRVSMHSGRARIVCPRSAVGFTVTLPSGLQIEDLGTEFELRIDDGGIARLFVHDGKVAATDPTGLRTVFEAGEGRAFGSAGRPLVDDAHAWLRGRLALGELRRDEALAALIDVSSSAEFGAELHGVELLREGEDDASMRFDGAGDYAELSDLGIDGSLTLMAWVKPTRVDSEFASIVMTPSWLPGGVHFQIVRDRLKLNMHSEVDFAADTPLVAGRWQHVAATVDIQSRRARLYIDGRRAGEAAVPETMTAKMDSATIGAWLQYGTAEPRTIVRPFAGEIDDVVIARRALSDETIAQLFRNTQTVYTGSETSPPVAKEQP